MNQKDVQIPISALDRQVSGILAVPDQAKALYILAHGAGAGMHHDFMVKVSKEVYDRRIATLRFQFPYMEDGRRMPDHKSKLLKVMGPVCDFAQEQAAGLPIFMGGRSMGGRISSLFLEESSQNVAKGLIFLGFPLHSAKKLGTEKAEHLFSLSIPMLFVRGTRDKLADDALMTDVCQKLGKKAKSFVVATGDHSLKPLKKSGLSEEDVMTMIGASIEAFVDENLSR